MQTPVLIALLTGLLPAQANDDGIIGYAWTGCTDCHGESPDPQVTVSLSADATEVAGGETIGLVVTVQSENPDHSAAGLNLAATGGTLIAGGDTLWRKGELSHLYPSWMTDGQESFSMSWTAPAFAAEVTLGVAGNAVNEDLAPHGDGWNLDTVAITVISDCIDGDGDGVGDCEGDCDDSDPTVWEEADCDSGTADGGTADGGTADGGTADGGTADGGTDDGGASDGGGDGGTSDGGTGVEPTVTTTKGCATGPARVGLMVLAPLLLCLRRRR